MKCKIKYLLIGLSQVVIFFISCNKKKLDIKPVNSQRLPQTVQDFQGLMDNTSAMNNGYPYLADISSDDYYLSYTFWNGAQTLQKNSFIWQKDVYAGLSSNSIVDDWNRSYNRIFYANVVLDGLNKISAQSNTDEYRNAKGCALFFSAFNYWKLAQIFCVPYNSASSTKDLGLILRTNSKVLEKTPRSTVEQTYQLIISDLIKASDLLPTTTIQSSRPTKAAAFGMLARVFISMSDYDQALKYATASLQNNNHLLDYNSLVSSSPFPIPQYNVETLISVTLLGNITSDPNNCFIDSTLFNMYSANDLRKVIFFKQSGSQALFKGSYIGAGGLIFSGLAVDEIYLTRAECYARKNLLDSAMQDLNILLRSRWKKLNNVTTYVDQTATDQTDALNKILSERRKELVLRGIRWTDVRRLNLAGANIILSRILNGQTYTLPPNDSRYVFPIPLQELASNPVPQNER